MNHPNNSSDNVMIMHNTVFLYRVEGYWNEAHILSWAICTFLLLEQLSVVPISC